MDFAEIQSSVIKAVAEQLDLPEGDVRADSTLQSLGADSLDALEVIMGIEQVFGIELADEQLEGMQDATVEQLAELVRKELQVVGALGRTAPAGCCGKCHQPEQQPGLRDGCTTHVPGVGDL